MSRIALALILALSAFAGDAAPALPTTPQQASLVAGDKNFAVIFVFAESLDGIEFAIEKADNPRTQLGRGKYQKPVYADPTDVAWLKGRNAQGERRFADAAAQYLLGAASRESWYTRHSSFLLAAECFLEAGAAADTIKALDAMLAMFPKSVEQARIAYLRGRALTKLGDGAGALKVFDDLSKRASDWGNDAASLGALGKADLLAAAKKYAEAAAALADIFPKLDPAKDPRFAQVGNELAKQLALAGQNAPAIAVLRRLAYGAPESDDRVQAQLAWTRLLVAAGDAASLFAAFDHAAIILGTRQVDGAALGQAQALVLQILARIDKLPADQCSNADKAEYRRYMQR